MPITILDAALARGVKKDDDGSINGAEFDRVGLPFFCGCECTASLGPGNAYPSKTGFTMCKDCITQSDDLGFATVAEFEGFSVQ